MILFVPFRYEAGLILDGETVEEAFQRHRNDNDSLNMHHSKLQNLLGAEKKMKRNSRRKEKYWSWRSRRGCVEK